MSKKEKPAAEQFICPSSGRCPPLAPRSCPHRHAHAQHASCGNPCQNASDWKANEPWCGPCQPVKPLTVPPVLAGRAEAEGGR